MDREVPGWLQRIDEKDIEELLRSHRGVMRDFARWVSEPGKVLALQEEVTRLLQENLRLRTVMLAAHEEITEHWEAHCDAEGFGPQSLVRHLKEGTGFYPEMIDKLTGGRGDGTGY